METTKLSTPEKAQIFAENAKKIANFQAEIKALEKQNSSFEKELTEALDKKGKITVGKFTLFLEEKMGRGGLSWAKLLEALPEALKLTKPQKQGFLELKESYTSKPEAKKNINFFEL
jgi:predicted  nucleic acid-binding Zn-ribbon protein